MHELERMRVSPGFVQSEQFPLVTHGHDQLLQDGRLRAGECMALRQASLLNVHGVHDARLRVEEKERLAVRREQRVQIGVGDVLLRKVDQRLRLRRVRAAAIQHAIRNRVERALMNLGALHGGGFRRLVGQAVEEDDVFFLCAGGGRQKDEQERGEQAALFHGHSSFGAWLGRRRG